MLAPLLVAMLAAAPASPTDGTVLAPSLPAFGADAAAVLAWPLQLQAPQWVALGAAAAGTGLLLRYDVQLYAALHRDVRWTFRGNNVFNATLYLGDGLVDLGVVSAFAVGDARSRRVALEGVEALAAVALTSTTAKHLFRVDRPETDPWHKHYFKGLGEDAFPSGHTMSAFATATVVSLEYPAAAPLAYPAATLVGLSVIERGWHWPSDVLAGAALGSCIGYAARAVNRTRWVIGPGPGAGLAAETRF
ncbi:MAG: phosphatase PAP2 family protein [Deltaproteobacteria bacterium]|nr:phosphatase PAP2 family protein [Deltaproteobacteria bacterium]